MHLGPGSLIAGKYRLDRPLAKGGMGEVWVAIDLSLGVPIAMKFMSKAALDMPELVARFEMEAKAAAQLRHPNVVQIAAHGVDRGVPFIAMELLEGEDLGARLKARGRLSVQEIASILRDVCRPLQRAHESKLVHRDLKPANIFLCKQDDLEIVKVLDFGIAKSMAEAAATLTKSGAIVGSPHYMSPEQARRTSQKVDHRTDLWALGVIAFRAVTGQLPFMGTNMIEVMVKVCRDPVPPPSSIAPDLGPQVDRFFEQALAREPERRFQSAREFSDALTALAALPAGDAQGALHRSWSDGQAPPPRMPDRPVTGASQAAPQQGAPPPRPGTAAPIPPPRTSERGALQGAPRASDPGTIAGRSAMEEADFDFATTVPLASKEAQRAIADKPWATQVRPEGANAPPTNEAASRVASAPPGASRSRSDATHAASDVTRSAVLTSAAAPSLDSPRASPAAPSRSADPRASVPTEQRIIIADNRPPPANAPVPPSDPRGPISGAPSAGAAVPAATNASSLSSPPDPTLTTLGTLTGSPAEIGSASGAPKRDKPWVILIAAGAAVVVVLVVIGAVLTTGDTSGSTSTDEPATSVFGGLPTSTQSIPPDPSAGIVASVTVSAEPPPTAVPSPKPSSSPAPTSTTTSTGTSSGTTTPSGRNKGSPTSTATRTFETPF